MKKVWLGSSWKMNKTEAEVVEYCRSIAPVLNNISHELQTFLIPPFPYVKQAGTLLAQTPCLTGVQNIGWAEQGALTGEVSVSMAKDIGATLVEIGHSERRQWFGECDETVNKKVILSLKAGLVPLICVGDSAEEKRWGVSAESIVRQVKIALYGVEPADLTKVMIAYEPVWAIGEGGSPASAQEAEAGMSAIRCALTSCYGAEIAHLIPLLYGGSVNLDNAQTLIAQPNIDGLFVGRTAWQADGFARLVELVSEVMMSKERVTGRGAYAT
ncbi:triose-phosphate isomerase [Vibrio sp. WXL210]|uniref:triose-phosphate isomerase n=1 Tax=Vibrio sp. WXL210 TaxID=3450709 RepID=UPI003EC51E2C